MEESPKLQKQNLRCRKEQSQYFKIILSPKSQYQRQVKAIFIKKCDNQDPIKEEKNESSSPLSFQLHEEVYNINIISPEFLIQERFSYKVNLYKKVSNFGSQKNRILSKQLISEASSNLAQIATILKAEEAKNNQEVQNQETKAKEPEIEVQKQTNQDVCIKYLDDPSELINQAIQNEKINSLIINQTQKNTQFS